MEQHILYDGNEKTELNYISDFLDSPNYTSISEWVKILDFKGGVRKNGKKIDREQIWFQEDKKYFCKYWKYHHDRWASHDYDETLLKLQEKINNEFKLKINSCLINKYNDGNDIIAPHKDNPLSFGEYPTILIYSIGVTRRFILTNDNTNEKYTFDLEPNSLFFMTGGSQKYYKHEIIKSETKDKRYSLTFREYLS